jgi:hypothetical protein
MTAQPQPAISEEEYLVYERASAIKHEYYRGRIYAMTGAKESHNRGLKSDGRICAGSPQGSGIRGRHSAVVT